MSPDPLVQTRKNDLRSTNKLEYGLKDKTCFKKLVVVWKARTDTDEVESTTLPRRVIEFTKVTLFQNTLKRMKAVSIQSKITASAYRLTYPTQFKGRCTNSRLFWSKMQ